MKRTDSHMAFRHMLTFYGLFMTAAALVSMTAAIAAFDIIHLRNSYVKQLTSVADILAGISTAAIEFDDPEGMEDILNAMREQKRIETAGIYREDGTLFAAYGCHQQYVGTDSPASERSR